MNCLHLSFNLPPAFSEDAAIWILVNFWNLARPLQAQP
jgi:hypothetical protein